MIFALLLLASDVHVEVRDNPPAFALEPGFLEAVPETPIIVIIDDASPTDELVLDVIRIGPLGKDKAKLTVTVDGRPRALTVLATTVENRKVGKQFASLPVRQRVPLPTGSAVVAIKAGEPMALKISVEAAPTGDIPLVPLTDDETSTPTGPATTTGPGKTGPATGPAKSGPATTGPATGPAKTGPATAGPTTATTGPATTGPTTAMTATTGPATTGPATTGADGASAGLSGSTSSDAGGDNGAPPLNPPSSSAEGFPRVYGELHAGGSLVANGLQTLVPAGGVRFMIGPRTVDAALGVAVDFDGQGTFIKEGRWDAATTRIRLEGIIGLGFMDLIDADLDLALGAGARISEHTAHAKGIQTTVTALGATVRVAPEGTFPAGPGRFLVAVPLDVGADLPDRVSNFAPVAVGVLLGYRLEL